RARTITHPYLGRRGVAVVCHQCQLVAVECVPVGGKLQTEYFNIAVAVVEGHSSGVAREDRKTGLRLHGAGDLAIGVGPVATFGRPSTVAATGVCIASLAVAIPDVQRHGRGVEQVDLLVVTELAYGKLGVGGLLADCQATVGFRIVAVVIEQAIQAGAEIAIVSDIEYGTVQAQITADMDLITLTGGIEIRPRRAEFIVQL